MAGALRVLRFPDQWAYREGRSPLEKRDIFFSVSSVQFPVELLEDDLLEIGKCSVFDDDALFSVKIDEGDSLSIDHLNDILFEKSVFRQDAFHESFQAGAFLESGFRIADDESLESFLVASDPVIGREVTVYRVQVLFGSIPIEGFSSRGVVDDIIECRPYSVLAGKETDIVESGYFFFWEGFEHRLRGFYRYFGEFLEDASGIHCPVTDPFARGDGNDKSVPDEIFEAGINGWAVDSRGMRYFRCQQRTFFSERLVYGMSVFRQSYPSENEFDVHVLKCTLFSTLFQ